MAIQTKQAKERCTDKQPIRVEADSFVFCFLSLWITSTHWHDVSSHFEVGRRLPGAQGLRRSKPLFYWMLHLLMSSWELNNIMLISLWLIHFSFSLSAALKRKHEKCCFLCMNNHFQMPDLSPEPPGKESSSKESVFIYFLLSVPITDRGLWFYSWWQVACISQGWNAKISLAWRQYQLDATCLSRAIR